ncbi:MAG: hypothetical protein GY822_32090 [Deltaproteobacteria bacterium]|nr:hypothetical protein [Deltaproteobacteria bacterium]
MLLFAGCPDEPPDTEPAVILIAGGSGQFVSVANGSSVLQVLVSAFDAENNGDSTPLSIDVEGGSLSETIDGFTEASVSTLSVTPVGGQTSFYFRCESGVPGEFQLNVANTLATATQTISCTTPIGDPTLVVGNGCSDLSADGQTRCPLDIELYVISGSSTFPVADATVEASVTTVTPVGAAFANEDVLSVDEEGGLTSDISISTTADGLATIWVASPEVLLEQTMEISITIKSGASEQSTTETVVIRPFVNASALTFNPTSLQVNGGGAASSVNLHVENPAGDVPRTNTSTVDADNIISEGDRIVLAVQGNHTDLTLTSDQGVADDGSIAAVSGKEITVAVDKNGDIPFTFGTETVTESKAVTVLASYRPISDLDALTETLEVNVTPTGTLLVNGIVAPLEIASDENETTLVTVTVSLDGSPQAGATVTFTPSSGDGERIGFGIFPDLETSVVETTDGDGVATVDLSARNGLVRGPATVSAEVAYDDNGTLREAYTEITVNVVREPVLQSLIFLTATPAIIGVRGGAIQSSSLMKFQVLDDQNLPVAGAQVDFDVNTTAAPGATVSTAGAGTNAQGEVEVVLSAGTQAGPITVVATAHLNGHTLQVESGPVAVIGGLPTFGNSYMVCDTENIYRSSGFETTCTVALVDRFTDISTLNQVVHFRAEGGNITPAVVTEDGTATGTFVTGQPGIVGADTTGWSFGAILPRGVGDLVNEPDANSNLRTFEAASCFDGNSNSKCDLIELCADGESPSANSLYCPLPQSSQNEDEGCWMVIAEALGTYEQFLAANSTIDQSAFTYTINSHFRAAVDGVVAVHENCGIPLPCLLGERTLFNFLSQPLYCPAALGCYDFDGSTPCPQSGLRTIMASTRGEETFVDTNGNGVFDYEDLNGNFTHDPGEPSEAWVDMPEPFLDKNDNCGRNDYTGHLRMAVIEEFENTDLFSDEDGSETFGYEDPVTGEISETNGKWDRDKEIFFQSHMVQLRGDPINAIRYGTICYEPGRIDEPCQGNAALQGLCREIAPGLNLSHSCATQLLATPLKSGETYNIAFAFADNNGNTYTPGFSSSAEFISAQVKIGGIKEVVLGPSSVTLNTDGSGNRNVNRPWCEETPNLSAKAFPVSVEVDCAAVSGDPLADARVEVNFANSSADGFAVSLSLAPQIDRLSCCPELGNPSPFCDNYVP